MIAGRYEVLGLLGSGGTASVHRARDRQTGDEVALKVLRGVSATDARQLEREVDVLARLRHDHVVRYLDHGRTDDGSLYLAMPWVDGEPLSVRLGRGRLAIDDTVRLCRHVVGALAAAHAVGVIHRDLKPANILLAGGAIDHPVVIDFGLAKLASAGASLTESGVVIGTPAYMAPEQARASRSVGAPADLFAIGCIVFECLTGAPPFVADHVWATLAKVLFDEPASVRDARADTPRELEALVGRLLAKDPAARPGAAEVLAILDAALTPAADRGPVRQFASAEKRLISVVVVGTASGESAADSETLAPGDLAREAGTTLIRVRDATASFGAMVEHLAGGHVLAILRGQGAAADRVAHAARCALTIRRDVPDAPVVLATGSAVVDGRLPIGAVIDHAARLLVTKVTPDADGALPVLLDPLSAGLLDGRFEMTQHGAVTELWRERPRAVPARTLLGRPAPFVGRDRELLTLEAVIAEVEGESVARAVLITADAGVGKSRLRHELTTRLDARGLGDRTWIARGDPTSAGAPFGMIARAIRGALGLEDGADPDAARARLEARVAEVCPPDQARRVRDFLGELVGVEFSADDHPALAAARRDPLQLGERIERAVIDFVDGTTRGGPLVIVLDDLHWGDLPSVRLLEETLLALADRPIGLIGLSRPDVDERFPGLWSRLACARWPLSELSRRACERLIREVVPLAAARDIESVVERAAGNAFLLEELIRCVADGRAELPATAVAVVEARLDALDPDGRRVVCAASVFGGTFWRGGIAHVLGPDVIAPQLDRWLDALAATELITPRTASRFAGERELAFRHVLVREAAYASLDDDDRRIGHARAADWLGAHGEPSAMLLAHHLDRGGEGERAAAKYHQAALEALAGHDYVAVDERAARGRALTRDPALDGRLALVASEGQRWSGHFREAVDLARGAIARFTVGDPDWLRAISQIGLTAALSTDFTLAEDMARSLIAHEPRAEGRDAWRIACAQLAARLLIAGRRAWARRLIEAADRADDTPSAAVEPWVLRARGLEAMRTGDMAAAAQLMATASAAFDRAGDERNAAIQSLNQAECLTELGALDAALAIATAHLHSRMAGTIGLHARAAIAKIAVYGNRPDLLEEGSEHDRPQQASALLLLDLAEGHRRARALGQAETLIARALEALEAYPTTRACGFAVQAMIALDRGRPAEALDAAERGFRATGPDAVDQRRPQVTLAYVLALEAVGRVAEAAALAGDARRELEQRAAGIDDPALRASFLDGVSVHRELLAAARRLAG